MHHNGPQDLYCYFCFLRPLMITKALRRLSVRGMSVYAQKMREAWKQDPKLVHQDWDKYFNSGVEMPSTQTKTDITQEDVRGKELALSAFFLIRYYRQRGHELSTLDPLSNPKFM